MRQERRGERPPNVGLILTDDLGYGDGSSYGAEDLRSPAIDRRVDERMRLDRFCANWVLTTDTDLSPTECALRYQELRMMEQSFRSFTPR